MRFAALQQAIFNRLNNSAVTSLLSSAYPGPAIFTDVPQPVDGGDISLFPYITYGVSTVAPFDTDDQPGGSAVVQVDVWFRGTSDLAMNAIGDAVDLRLRRQPLSIAGTTHITTELVSATKTDDPDGMTKRIMLLFRVLYLD
jgi:hypothetical protein